MQHTRISVHYLCLSIFHLLASCATESGATTGYDGFDVTGHDETTLLSLTSSSGTVRTGVFGEGHSYVSDDGSTLLVSVQVYRACCVGYQHLILSLPIAPLPTTQVELSLTDASFVDATHAGVELEVGPPDGFELVAATSGSLTVRRLVAGHDGFDVHVVFNDVGFAAATGAVTLDGILDAGTSYRYSATRAPHEVICDEPAAYDPLEGSFAVCAQAAYMPAFITCAEMAGNDSEVATCSLAALDAVPLECGSFCEGTFTNVPIPFLAPPGAQP